MRAALLVMLGLCLPAAAWPVEQADVTELVARLDALRGRHGVPAVGFTLVDREHMLYGGAFGLADVASGRPADAQTVFRIGSITKAFTSLAVLLLAEEGKLALDDRVAALADSPPYANRWEASDPVRVAHLLEHTAGLTDLSREEFAFNEPLSLAAALALQPQSRTTQWPPGRHSSYTNAAAGIAAWLIEQRSGLGYEDFVEQRLFEPLGMDSAGLALDERTAAQLATGYEADGRTVIAYWHMLFRAFGAINVRPAQMAPFLRLLLNDGRHAGRQLLSAGSIARMERPATTLAARDGLAYGYGLGQYHWLRDGHIFHGHGGDGDGYLAHFGYNRDAGLGYFVVINAFDHRPLAEMRALIERFIVADLPPATEPPLARLSAAELQALAGTYAPATARFPDAAAERTRLRVGVTQKRLWTRIDGARRRPLLPVGGRHFRRPGQPMATAAFVTDDDGTLVLQGEMGNWRRLEEPLPKD